jgi:hypothetical protein
VRGGVSADMVVVEMKGFNRSYIQVHCKVTRNVCIAYVNQMAG